MFIEELESILKNAISNLKYDTTNIKIIKSNRPELCDYQCDDAFKLAKIHDKTPLVIGEEIVIELNKIANFADYFTKVEFIRPGFINMTLSAKFINTNLNKMNPDNKFNLTRPEKKQLYFLDYGGPNIAKPLHVGHLRPAIIGESLKRIINFKGHNTISDIHLGDYGTQIGQVIYGIIKDNKSDKITLEYLEKIYPKISLLCKNDEEVYAQCQNITKKLQAGNKDYQKIWQKICDVSLKDIKRIYKYLDISFDLWKGESDSYPYIEPMIAYLEAKKVVTISDEAKIIEVKEPTDTKEMPPFMLQKSDGAYLYSTTDLATIYERVKKYSPHYILYVVDARQQLHFEQVFRAAKKGNINEVTNLEHIWFGTMNGIDGKPFKTRDGEMLNLDDLFHQVKENFVGLKPENKDMSATDIDKIVNAIIKFADLQTDRERNYIFDIKKFSDVIGKTGPYILYTYLRINKLLHPNDIEKLNDNIYNDEDRKLRLQLIELETAVNNAVNERKPSFIADYLYELCDVANTFYQNNRLMDLNDKTKKEEWVYLLTLTNQIIKKLLELLIIKIPTKM